MAPSKKRKRGDDSAELPATEPVEDALVAGFAEAIAKRAEVFAQGGLAGQELADEALQVAKHLFDQCLSLRCPS